jgi:hypothetical protein
VSEILGRPAAHAVKRLLLLQENQADSHPDIFDAALVIELGDIYRDPEITPFELISELVACAGGILHLLADHLGLEASRILEHLLTGEI